MKPGVATAGVTGVLLAAGLVLHLAGQTVHWPSFFFMVAFYAAVVFIGAWAGSRENSGSYEEMMLAGRCMPLWLGVFTMSATWVGGGYINGTAEYTASQGLAWVQAPWGYALSLVLGGVFFARKMRSAGHTTLLDPLAAKYGEKVAASLYLVALSGELFWTGAILAALGTTFGVILGINFTAAIILSALVAVFYTALGGLWAVAGTDVLQLIILLFGLWLVIPFAAEPTGGMAAAWSAYQLKMGALASFGPDPAWGDLYWTWWDYALLLVLGGIPWQVYFQRVLASRDDRSAIGLSVVAGGVCLLAAAPAVAIGVIGAVVDWSSLGLAGPSEAALTLPYVMRHLLPTPLAAIGLGALAAAVMSSVDSSILSASSMAAWNVYRPLINPKADSHELGRVVRWSVWGVGLLATILALTVKSVYALWFLCSDFVYCILFPQLVTALFDPKANRTGSLAGLAVSFVLRFGGGDATLGLPVLLPYPMMDPEQGLLFPFRTLSMVCGLITIMIVSRLRKLPSTV